MAKNNNYFIIMKTYRYNILLFDNLVVINKMKNDIDIRKKNVIIVEGIYKYYYIFINNIIFINNLSIIRN